MSAPVQVFISYAREDEAYKDTLKKWLKHYERNGLVQLWDDSKIPPGGEWDQTIKDALKEAEVLVFLISNDFMASDYIDKVEIKSALEKYQNNEIIIVPVIIRAADFSALHLSKFQALPRNATPISSYTDQDAAWLDVGKGLRTLFQDIQKKRKDKPLSEKPTKASAPQKETQNNNETGFDKDKVKDLLGKFKVEKALKILLNHEGFESDVHNQFILQSARFNSLKKQNTSGALNRDEFQRGNNRIMHALLSIIDDLED